MTRAWRWLPTALCCVCALPAAGAIASLHIDPAHSHAEFGVHVLWFGKVVGRLDALHGRVRIDTNGQARVDVVVDARSLRMHNTDYEAFASGPGFFDSARYPAIDFRSVPFPVKQLSAGGPVEGALTLRGITHTVRFDLLPQPCALFAGARATDTPAAASSAAPAVATTAPALAA
ncbi:MAG: YceI family protein, partial [Metallibacterium sp.]